MPDRPALPEEPVFPCSHCELTAAYDALRSAAEALREENERLREERLRARGAAVRAGFHGGDLAEIIDSLRSSLASARADALEEVAKKLCPYCSDGRQPQQHHDGGWWHEVARGGDLGGYEPCHAYTVYNLRAAALKEAARAISQRGCMVAPNW